MYRLWASGEDIGDGDGDPTGEEVGVGSGAASMWTPETCISADLTAHATSSLYGSMADTVRSRRPMGSDDAGTSGGDETWEAGGAKGERIFVWRER